MKVLGIASDGVPEQQVRELFALLRTLTPPIMREGEHRIRTVVGPNEPLHIDHQTIRFLTGRRPGQLDVLQLICLSAGRPLEAYARLAIGPSQDGTIMVTPNLNPRRISSGSRGTPRYWPRDRIMPVGSGNPLVPWRGRDCEPGALEQLILPHSENDQALATAPLWLDRWARN